MNNSTVENERVVLGSASDLNHVDLLGDARVLGVHFCAEFLTPA
jgi:hypothetical protein